MTEYEVLDLLSSYHQTVVAVSMAFLAICSGFVVMIHFVGKKLGAIQLFVVIAVYSAYLVLPVAGIFDSTNRRMYLFAELKRVYGDPAAEPETMVYQSVVFLMIWLLTLYYCWYVRSDDSHD